MEELRNRLVLHKNTTPQSFSWKSISGVHGTLWDPFGSPLSHLYYPYMKPRVEWQFKEDYFSSDNGLDDLKKLFFYKNAKNIFFSFFTKVGVWYHIKTRDLLKNRPVEHFQWYRSCFLPLLGVWNHGKTDGSMNFDYQVRDLSSALRPSILPFVPNFFWLDLDIL